MERVTGFKPVVSTLGKLHVITTPYPHNLLTLWIISDTKLIVKHFLLALLFFFLFLSLLRFVIRFWFRMPLCIHICS